MTPRLSRGRSSPTRWSESCRARSARCRRRCSVASARRVRADRRRQRVREPPTADRACERFGARVRWLRIDDASRRRPSRRSTAPSPPRPRRWSARWSTGLGSRRRGSCATRSPPPLCIRGRDRDPRAAPRPGRPAALRRRRLRRSRRRRAARVDRLDGRRLPPVRRLGARRVVARRLVRGAGREQRRVHAVASCGRSWEATTSGFAPPAAGSRTRICSDAPARSRARSS